MIYNNKIFKKTIFKKENKIKEQILVNNFWVKFRIKGKIYKGINNI